MAFSCMNFADWTNSSFINNRYWILDNHIISIFTEIFAQSAGAVEYTDCTSAEG